MTTYKIQSLRALREEMKAVARGERYRELCRRLEFPVGQRRVRRARIEHHAHDRRRRGDLAQ